MAEPLSSATVASGGSIEPMEQAVRLLRQTPLSTLLCHWLGSAPLAVALLLFRNQVLRPRLPASTAAVYALLLTLLLIWMNCWRAVFAGRLRRQLSGARDAPWTGRRVFGLIALQAYFGATKLFILPLAALIMFTFADTVAFYRIAAVLADGDTTAGDDRDPDPLQLRSRARQLAVVARGQNWTILAILLLLQVVVAINLTLAIAVLPQLLRILTGIETAFSRSGWAFVVNPLFPFLVMAVTWLALDPFVQAVYCVRCFRAESIETGEDVRAGLRRIRIARQVVAAAVLLIAGGRVGHAVDAVSPDRLEQAITQTMQAHEYDWRLPPPADSVHGHAWIVDATDRAIAGLRSVFHSIGESIRAFFKWLLRQFGGMPELGPGAPPGTGLHWSVYVLIGLVLAAGLWIVRQRRRARRANASRVGADSATAVRLDSEDLTPDRLPEEQWLELALRCLGERNFRLALRAYYLANLAWLGRREFITIHSGKTNREYQLELRRRARAFPEAGGLFAANVAAFERAWYGMHEVAVEDTDEFRNRMEQMRAQMQATPGAPKEAAA